MKNDSNPITIQTLTVKGIKFSFTFSPLTDPLLKDCQLLHLSDDNGNERLIVWNPNDDTVEQVIASILESKRWP